MRGNTVFTAAATCLIVGALIFSLGQAGNDRTGLMLQIGAVLLVLGAVLMTNTNNRAIAMNTFREALRNKVLYIILVFAVLMIGFTAVLGSISIGESDRVIKHVGLSAINIFGVFLALFVGVNLVYDEMERRTIYTIIAHGIPRHDFIIGKFLGLLLTITFNFVLMGVILSAVLLAVPEAHLHWAVWYALFLCVLEMMIILSFAILFSSFSTPVLSAVLTLGVFLCGHFSDDLLTWIKILSHQAYEFHSASTVLVLKGVYCFLPHLKELSAINSVVQPETIEWTLFPVGYGILYTTVVLGLACFIFSKRDFR